MPAEREQKGGPNYDDLADIKLPTLGGLIDHYPEGPLCPWCRKNKVSEPHSFAVLSGGALLMNREKDTGLPDDNLDGFLSLSWHGAHDEGEGEDSDIDANVDVARGVRGGQFEMYFCSISCLRSYSNHCLDQLEKEIRAERLGK